jgi:hypothetical protein
VDARTNAATDGPWERQSGPFDYVTNGHVSIGREHTTPDAEFIAHARTDLPAATAALRAVLDLLDQVEGEDEWSLMHSEDVRSVITAALESGK